MRPEHYKQLPKGVRCRCPKMWREADGSYWCCDPKSQPLGPTEPRQCLRCGTIDAFGSISKESQLATLVQTIEAEAQRYAEMYPQSSDGRNTFMMFADWVATLALSSNLSPRQRE